MATILIERQLSIYPTTTIHSVDVNPHQRQSSVNMRTMRCQFCYRLDESAIAATREFVCPLSRGRTRPIRRRRATKNRRRHRRYRVREWPWLIDWPAKNLCRPPVLNFSVGLVNAPTDAFRALPRLTCHRWINVASPLCTMQTYRQPCPLGTRPPGLCIDITASGSSSVSGNSRRSTTSAQPAQLNRTKTLLQQSTSHLGKLWWKNYRIRSAHKTISVTAVVVYSSVVWTCNEMW